MYIPAFITVRTLSSRLPQKCLLPFGEGNILEHIIRRAKYYKLDPIVCTTIDPSDEIVTKIAKKEGVEYFRGSVRNKLKRWYDCCEHFKIEQFHSVDADDPYFDGDEIRASFSILNDGFEMVCPSNASSSGAASVGYSLSKGLIGRALKNINVDENTEMMWYYLENVLDLKKAILPDSQFASQNIRLTLDYEEDYWLLQTIRRILGNYPAREDVDKLFIANPDLHKINWFRNVEWKEGQAK